MKPVHSVTLIGVLLASLSALQAAESQTPVANPDRMPAFSWDTVPLYVHIRKNTAFTDAEIRYLATFPIRVSVISRRWTAPISRDLRVP